MRFGLHYLCPQKHIKKQSIIEFIGGQELRLPTRPAWLFWLPRSWGSGVEWARLYRAHRYSLSFMPLPGPWKAAGSSVGRNYACPPLRPAWLFWLPRSWGQVVQGGYGCIVPTMANSGLWTKMTISIRAFIAGMARSYTRNQDQ
jgi:hypothetical protein